MSWRRVVTTLVLLLAAVGLGLGANLAHAAPQATYGPPKEGAKAILADTSIDGPAIVGGDPGFIMAWTGTDPAHHLNVMTSSDGLHYGNKHVLPETSLWRPALAHMGSARGEPYGTIYLAWTGTDPAHTLNLEFISMPDFTVTKKFTFWGENSFTAPAFTVISEEMNSDLYLAWTGTDRAHTLNVLQLVVNPLDTIQSRDKHTLWGWNSVSRPNLEVDRTSNTSLRLILSWAGVNNRIYFANGAYAGPPNVKVTWTMPSTSPLSHQSAWAPSMIAFGVSTLPTHWLAWTGNGTTSSRNLHVQYTQHYPSWSDANASATLSETAISSPEATVNANVTTSKILLAWTGTDAAHHLNVAWVGV